MTQPKKKKRRAAPPVDKEPAEKEPAPEKTPAPEPASAEPWWRAVLGLGILVGALGAGIALAPAKGAAGGPAASGAIPRPRPAASGPAPTGNAVIHGVVRFEGTAPAPEPWEGARNADCSSLGGDTIQLVKVKDGHLQDAFVYVDEGLPAGSYSAPDTPVVFDQRGCEFAPRVFGVMVGQPIEIGNSDRFVHNVRTPAFNQAFVSGAKRTTTIEEPAIMSTIKCDMHPWMRAYAGVLEHPYYATSGADGRFEITGLVDGKYTLVAWHEKLGTQKGEATAPVDKAAPVEIVFRAN